jgi:hypothetical protein
MFEHTSRYYLLETATIRTPEGRDVVYKRRRFLPLVKQGAVLVEHTVTQGERLDNITARYLGDPELFWQLAMDPKDLTAEIGRKLRLSLPGI